MTVHVEYHYVPERGLVVKVGVRATRSSSVAVALSRVVRVGVAITGVSSPECCPIYSNSGNIG